MLFSGPIKTKLEMRSVYLTQKEAPLLCDEILNSETDSIKSINICFLPGSETEPLLREEEVSLWEEEG